MDDDLLSPACPKCGHRGLEYDQEFKAWVHDLCGYWKDEDPLDEWYF